MAAIKRLGDVSGLNAMASCFACDARLLTAGCGDEFFAHEGRDAALAAVIGGVAVFRSVLGAGAQGLYAAERWLCLVDPHEDADDAAAQELRAAAATKPDKAAMDACQTLPVPSRLLAIGAVSAAEAMTEAKASAGAGVVPVPLWGTQTCGFFLAVAESEYLVTAQEVRLPSWREAARISYIFPAKHRQELAFTAKVVKRRNP